MNWFFKKMILTILLSLGWRTLFDMESVRLIQHIPPP